MPLPSAWGEKQRTSQAAKAAAPAQVATTNRNPANFSSTTQAINALRQRSACSSERRKTAPTSPADAPAKSDRSARLVSPAAHTADSAASSVTLFIGFIGKSCAFASNQVVRGTSRVAAPFRLLISYFRF